MGGDEGCEGEGEGRQADGQCAHETGHGDLRADQPPASVRMPAGR
jgi:hypothetical protein